MPVKKYRVRYLVVKTGNVPLEERRKLVELLKNECEKHQPGFRFKVVRETSGILVAKCAHKAVPSVRSLLSRLAADQPSFTFQLIGVSGTLKKAIRKFCHDTNTE
ncbi:MAG: Rpp14/Pop5 family protein [Crenarchaeota archaeon]|nr:Rpp14/Pop5 family protein [Thermoproteota archaeon]